ncbi:MAG: efflux RND transporter periplasmic adaptor subunit [Acidobacteriota bacterium]
MQRSVWVLFLAFTLVNVVFAHGGEDHSAPPTPKPASSTTARASARTDTRNVETSQGIFKATLAQLPGSAQVEQEVQFEVELKEVIEGGFAGGLLPLEAASVTADLKTANGETLASRLETHSEGKPGVYGVHLHPTAAGEYRIVFNVSTSTGANFAVEFPFSVTRAPLNYRLYGVAGFWLVLMVGFGTYRFRRVRVLAHGDSMALLRRLAMEYGCLSAITIIGILIFNQIDWLKALPSETALAAAVAAVPASNTITLTKESQLLFGIKTVPVTLKPIVSGFQVNGFVRVPPQSQATMSTPITGLVRFKRSLTVGDIVRQGETIAQIEQVMGVSDQIGLESYRLEQRIRRTQARDEAEHSRQRLVAANVELSRVRKLYEAGAVPLKQLQEAEQRMQFASAEAAHAQQNLIDVGEDFKDPVTVQSLRAPITGLVATVSAVNGEQVDAGKAIMTIVDLSNIWIEAQVFENDLRKVLAATQASYRVPGLSDEVYTVTVHNKERLFTIATGVNLTARTVPVYFKVANPDNLLRDGMAAEISIDTSNGRELLSVPREAVVDDQGEKIVFVYKGGEQFERRLVRVNSIGLAEAEIATGLETGERVVVEGLYQLRAGIIQK